MDVKERIRQLGPGATSAIAALGGVSPAAVSKLSSNPTWVSESDTEKILATLADLEMLMTAVREARAEGSPLMIDLKDTENLRAVIELVRKAESERQQIVQIEASIRCSAHCLAKALDK